jgi:hypothetical protein
MAVTELMLDGTKIVPSFVSSLLRMLGSGT